MVSLRQHRDVVEAPWQEGTLRFPSVVRWLPAVTGIAAVLVLAVGLAMRGKSSVPTSHSITAEAPLGEMSGGFQSTVRGEGDTGLQYTVRINLKSSAHLTWLYLDYTRKLQLPQNAPQKTQRMEAGVQEFLVTVDGDPPGPQWIAAIASASSLDAFALRAELQRSIDTGSSDGAFENLIRHLEQILSARKDLQFRSHEFVVLGPGGKQTDSRPQDTFGRPKDRP